MERSNPGSVGFQIGVLNAEAERFPGDHNFGLFPNIQKRLGVLNQRFGSEELPNEKELTAMRAELETLSDLITQHYFSHSVRRIH